MILGETARASNVDLSTPVPVLKHLPCLNDCEFIPFNHASVSCSSPLTEMVYGHSRYPSSTHCQRIAVLSCFDHTLGSMFVASLQSPSNVSIRKRASTMDPRKLVADSCTYGAWSSDYEYENFRYVDSAFLSKSRASNKSLFKILSLCALIFIHASRVGDQHRQRHNPRRV